MRRPGYEIVFRKLAEAKAELGLGAEHPQGDLTPEEAEEIDQLRQIALEIEEPQLESHTSTWPVAVADPSVA